MKIFSLVVVSVLFSASAFARNSQAIQAVLANDEVAALSFIQKIEVVAEYKCPQCFDVLVSGEQEVVEGLPAEKAFIKLNTEGSLFSDEITVKVIERSK